jgi:large subunit ribosomal protein L6
MSRIGKKPVVIPEGVTVTVADNHVTVKGPKGQLARQFSKELTINVDGSELTVTRPTDNKLHRSLHGTTRSVISNMVEGVTTGFTKTLEMVGVGYRAAKAGNKITLSVGKSHPVEIAPEEGIEFDLPAATTIVVKGIDKERVGQVAAEIRSVREPEPYKGKGIRYQGERVRRKEGKTGKKK